MGTLNFLAGRESELRVLINNPDRSVLDGQLRQVACRGMDTDAFHPDDGRPEEIVLARCFGCKARLACLALAMRIEEPDMRYGWYGGLGSDDRTAVADALALEVPARSVPDKAVHAARLKAGGWTVDAIAAEFGCSRRTVQRYLRTAAA